MGDLTTSDSRMSKRLKWFVIIAGGCWMLGEGARMVVLALFYQGWHYEPNMFDMFFDWVPLTILGSIFFYQGIRTFYVDKVGELNQTEDISLVKVRAKKNRHKATKNPK